MGDVVGSNDEYSIAQKLSKRAKQRANALKGAPGITSSADFDDEDGAWVLQSHEDLSLRFVKPKASPEMILPVGRHNWIMNSSGVVDNISLTFSVCKEGQFTCDSGHCIDILYKDRKYVTINSRLYSFSSLDFAATPFQTARTNPMK